MLRTDGTPFNRETEQERWAYVEAVETRLLRNRTVHDTVQELNFLYSQRFHPEDEAERDHERVQYLAMMQRRLSALSTTRSSAVG